MSGLLKSRAGSIEIWHVKSIEISCWVYSRVKSIEILRLLKSRAGFIEISRVSTVRSTEILGVKYQIKIS